MHESLSQWRVFVLSSGIQYFYLQSPAFYINIRHVGFLYRRIILLDPSIDNKSVRYGRFADTTNPHHCYKEQCHIRMRMAVVRFINY